MAAITVTTGQLEDVTVLEVSGEVDLSTVDEMREALAAAVSTDPLVLVIDLLGVTFLGSAALAAMAETRESMRRSDALRIVVGPANARLFELTALDHLFDLYSSVESAVVV